WARPMEEPRGGTAGGGARDAPPADTTVAAQPGISLPPAPAGRPLSVNSTYPPSGTGLTVAVNVTCAPGADGFCEDVSVVVVAVVTSAVKSTVVLSALGHWYVTVPLYVPGLSYVCVPSTFPLL